MPDTVACSGRLWNFVPRAAPWSRFTIIAPLIAAYLLTPVYTAYRQAERNPEAIRYRYTRIGMTTVTQCMRLVCIRPVSQGRYGAVHIAFFFELGKTLMSNPAMLVGPIRVARLLLCRSGSRFHICAEERDLAQEVRKVSHRKAQCGLCDCRCGLYDRRRCM